MVFNERNLYMDKDVPDNAKDSAKKKEQVDMEEITKDDITIRTKEDPELILETPQLRRPAMIPKS